MRITIQELLAAEELTGVELIAGAAGKENCVELTNVVDSWDLHKWLTGNELVLSNGLLFAGQPERLAQVVRDLSAAGAAGLLIKLGRYLSTIPPDAVLAADTCGFPLITAKENLQFGTINRLLNRQANKLPQSSHRYAAFAELQAKDSGIPAYLRLLDGFIGHICVYRDNLSGKTFSSRNDRPHHPTTENVYSRNVVAGGNVCGTLLVLDCGTELIEDELTSVTIDYASSMLGISQQKLLPSRFRDEYWKERFVSELLRGSSVVSDDEIQKRGLLCGYDFFRPSIVSVAEGADRYQETAMQIEREACEISLPGPPVFFLQLENQLIILYAGQDQEPLLRWCKELSARCRIAGITVYIGIGRLADTPKQLYKSYQDACQSLHVGSRLSGHGVYNYNSMGMANFLCTYAATAEAAEVVQEVLGTLMEYDEKKPAYSLLPTLQTIARCGFNLTSAAEELYIHYNTLKYRYMKIGEISGLDLSDFAVQNKVYIALALLRLRNDGTM